MERAVDSEEKEKKEKKKKSKKVILSAPLSGRAGMFLEQLLTRLAVSFHSNARLAVTSFLPLLLLFTLSPAPLTTVPAASPHRF